MNDIVIAVLTSIASAILFLMLIGVTIEAFFRERDKK